MEVCIIGLITCTCNCVEKNNDAKVTSKGRKSIDLPPKIYGIDINIKKIMSKIMNIT